MATWTDFKRDVRWLVKITLDQCQETFGTAPCTATGTPCYYSRPTCKDAPNYNKGTYTWQFTLAEASEVYEDALAFLKDVEQYETRIDPNKALTLVGKYKIKMSDSAPLQWSCPGKSLNTTEHNRESAGTFWLNLKARNPNYRGRPVEVLVGLASWSLASYRTYFKGILTNIEITGDGEVVIEAKDRLKLTDRKVPRRQGDSNVLTSTYSGGATMDVTDGTEFMDPDDHGGECVVCLESGGNKTYVTYTGLSGDQLTGCTTAAFGSDSASHNSGTKVKNVLVIADSTDTAATSWSDCGRMPACWCFLRLLCDFTGIDPDDTAVVDYSVTLDGGIGVGDSVLTLSDATGFPYRGIVKIGAEWLYYGSLDGNDLAGLRRGLFGSSAAAHSDGDPVYISQFSDEAGRWLATNLYKYRAEKETALKDILQKLRLATGVGHLWVGEDSLVHFKAAPGLTGLDSPLDLTDAANLATGTPPSHDDGEEERRTLVRVGYSPTEVDASEDESSWSFLVHWNPTLEAADYLNETFRETIYNPWIWDEESAILCATYRLLRRQHGFKTLTFSLDLKDAMQIEMGDFVKITTAVVVGTDGSERSSVVYEVLKKKRKGDSLYEFEVWDVTGGIDAARYAVIAPSSVSHDYDSATAAEKEAYGWISDGNGQVGADDEDGYLII